MGDDLIGWVNVDDGWKEWVVWIVEILIKLSCVRDFFIVGLLYFVDVYIKIVEGFIVGFNNDGVGEFWKEVVGREVFLVMKEF